MEADGLSWFQMWLRTRRQWHLSSHTSSSYFCRWEVCTQGTRLIGFWPEFSCQKIEPLLCGHRQRLLRSLFCKETAHSWRPLPYDLINPRGPHSQYYFTDRISPCGCGGMQTISPSQGPELQGGMGSSSRDWPGVESFLSCGRRFQLCHPMGDMIGEKYSLRKRCCSQLTAVPRTQHLGGLASHMEREGKIP